MRYKTREKVPPEKATLEHALKYTIYLIDRFHLLIEHKSALRFNAVSPYERSVQRYLITNASRNQDNELAGIMAVRDFWRGAKYSTGGRIYLYMGGRGPLFEALDSEAVITNPVDYEEKDLIIRKIYSGLSDTVPPNAGNIHLHPHLCNIPHVDNQSVRQELIADHGTQNAIGPDAPLQYFLFRVKKGEAEWDKTTTDKDVQKVFSYAA